METKTLEDRPPGDGGGKTNACSQAARSRWWKHKRLLAGRQEPVVETQTLAARPPGAGAENTNAFCHAARSPRWNPNRSLQDHYTVPLDTLLLAPLNTRHPSTIKQHCVRRLLR